MPDVIGLVTTAALNTKLLKLSTKYQLLIVYLEEKDYNGKIFEFEWKCTAT